MPRLQVYLPDELYRQLKEQELPASELLQEAVRAELRRRELSARMDEHLEALAEQVGDPPAQEQAKAEALAERIVRRRRRTA